MLRFKAVPRIALAAAFIILAATAISQTAQREQVGPASGGGFLLNSGWRLQPAGTQVPLNTLPISATLSPDGGYALVLNAGYHQPSISVIELASAKVVSETPVEDAWLGLAFAPKTNRLYVGGGGTASVYEFSFEAGKLSAGRVFHVSAENSRTPQDFIGDIAFSPDGRTLLAASLYRNAVISINPQSGMVTGRYATGRRPYRILFHPDGKSYFVTNWADGSVGHYDAANGSQLALIRVAPHPTDIVWRAGGATSETDDPPYVARLFVATAHTNMVYVLAVSASKEVRALDAINTGMTSMQPVGMTPSSLALSPDSNTLYAACSGANAVAALDVSADLSRVAGYIPAGWYPTAVKVTAQGGLVVLNGKGGGSRPNPNGPDASRMLEIPGRGIAAPGYVADLQRGTASIIPPYNPSQLASWTQTASANSPYTDADLVTPSPLPAIEHVVYILKEGRTYDDIFGDVKEGNGDASLALFGESVAPNHHKLARQFALLDNFYANGDVSADGYNWATGAIAPDYVEKLWPNSYAGRRNAYDYEQGDPASVPPAAYLWTNAITAGISVRNFGHMVDNKPGAALGEEQVLRVRDPGLAKVTNRLYRGPDLDFPDTERAKAFLTELADYVKTGSMPRLTLLRLGNDRTQGNQAGKLSPRAMVADNDAALGTIVEAISKSRFWASTAIFVIEASAEGGRDHVDAHRSPALVISPFVKRGVHDGGMYNTASILRTMEYLLGLRPMTQFDAAARPLAAVFQATPDPSRYDAEKPRLNVTEKNSGTR
jgi:DNA-binding beta-propeller fold protein YncE